MFKVWLIITLSEEPNNQIPAAINVSILLITLSCYIMISGYHINDPNYNYNVLAQFFPYFLFYMKPDTISIIISGITGVR